MCMHAHTHACVNKNMSTHMPTCLNIKVPHANRCEQIFHYTKSEVRVLFHT